MFKFRSDSFKVHTRTFIPGVVYGCDFSSTSHEGVIELNTSYYVWSVVNSLLPVDWRLWSLDEWFMFKIRSDSFTVHTRQFISGVVYGYDFSSTSREEVIELNTSYYVWSVVISLLPVDWILWILDEWSMFKFRLDSFTVHTRTFIPGVVNGCDFSSTSREEVIELNTSFYVWSVVNSLLPVS